MIATYLETNFDQFFSKYNRMLIQSENYVIKRQSIKLLGELLLDHSADFKDDPAVVIIATTNSGQLMEAINRLKSQVESMVVILLDAASFGSPRLPLNSAHMLAPMGVQVYQIRKGDEMSKALDSRSTFWNNDAQD